VDADVFDTLPQLLESPYAGVREWTADILRSLAKNDCGLKLILSSKHMRRAWVSVTASPNLHIIDLDDDNDPAATARTLSS
jgi:hypothetical protein